MTAADARKIWMESRMIPENIYDEIRNSAKHGLRSHSFDPHELNEGHIEVLKGDGFKVSEEKSTCGSSPFLLKVEW